MVMIDVDLAEFGAKTAHACHMMPLLSQGVCAEIKADMTVSICFIVCTLPSNLCINDVDCKAFGDWLDFEWVTT